MIIKNIYSLLLALFFFTACHAEDFIDEMFSSLPEQVFVNSDCCDFLIGGVINPLNGAPSMSEIDLVSKGAQSIELKRIFTPYFAPIEDVEKGLFSEKSYSGWLYFPHTRLNLCTLIKHNKIHERQACVVDPNGVVLVYSLENGKMVFSSKTFGISNGFCGTPSGKYDPRNVHIEFKKNYIIVKTPDGFVRHYLQQYTDAISDSKSKYECTLCLLRKEVLPNGKVLHYYYRDKNLTRVESWDPNEKHLYATLHLDFNPYNSIANFWTDNGLKASFEQVPALINQSKEFKKNKSLLNPLIVLSADTPFYSSNKCQYVRNPLEGKSKERQYLGLVEYKGQCINFQAEHKEFAQTQLINHEKSKRNKYDSQCRVKTLLLPGEGNSMEPAFHFDYDIAVPGKKSGKTVVTHWNGCKTIYNIQLNLLISSIQFFDESNTLKKEKIFKWDKNHWLTSVEVCDEEGNVLYKKSYQYDSFGNPIVETIEGELSEKGVQDVYTIQRMFSQEGRNLLLEEHFGEGKQILYSYIPNTNLLSKKIVKANSVEISWEYYEYDDCLNLIKKVAGEEGVERVTNYVLRREQPFLHMPEWIEESYIENDVKYPLKRTKLIYDNFGNVVKEEVYDADNQYSYTIEKKYNERGDVVFETDPIGRSANYTYDEHGRKKSVVGFSRNNETLLSYDLKGRQTEISEVGLKDHVLVNKSYRYDHNDCIIKKTDPFGHETTLTYDSISLEPERINYPGVIIDDEVYPVVKAFTYDALGRKLASIDENGNKTVYSYNLYDSPCEILHPHNTKETFKYRKDGHLLSHTDQEGLTTLFKRDGAGRVEEKLFVKDGECIAKEVFIYKGTRLVEMIDKEKNSTKYFYDGAGRKVCEDRCGKKTYWSYDSLGFLKTICEESTPNTLYTHFKRDNIGQVLEKSYTDAAGNVLNWIKYTYDVSGNVSTITTNVNGSLVVESFDYDSQNRLISHKNRSGFTTNIYYDDHFADEKGRFVLRKVKTAPNQIVTEEIYDPFGRIVKQQVYNNQNSVVSAESKSYDPCGSLILWRQNVYEGEDYLNTKVISFSYDQKNRLSSYTRGVGTSSKRITQFSYTPGDQIKCKALPDGNELEYQYDSFGYLKSLSSSDGTIKHTFSYDTLGNLLRASDDLEKTFFEREYDPFGNVTKEKFSNGITIKKSYDYFNRPLTVTLPDESQICYSYDPLHLKVVERYAANGMFLYRHCYDKYDLNGNLESETLIGNLGSNHYSFNESGAISTIQSSYFSQSCMYDEADNLTSITTDNLQRNFTYDPLNQLLSEAAGEVTTTYLYDSTYNRTKVNKEPWISNALDELESTPSFFCSYDKNGNLKTLSSNSITKKYTYDPLNQLTAVEDGSSKVVLKYDPLGRRISKTTDAYTENYLYDGNNDIGTLDQQGRLKHLCVLGIEKNNISRPISIELEGNVFAPIIDCQGNVSRLVKLVSGEVSTSYEYNAFGEQSQKDFGPFNPWQYASKRFDADINFIDFGKRYYVPQLGRWLNTDPAEFVDGSNLYAFLKNSPYRYVDADGRFVQLFIPILVGGFTLGGEVAIGFAAGEAITASLIGAALGVGVYQAWQKLNLGENGSEIAGLLSDTVQDAGKDKRKKDRNHPLDLEEQLALEEAKAGKGEEIMWDKINDPRYPPDKWNKKKHNHEHTDGTKTEIHYWENIQTGERHGYKIKVEDNNKSRSNLYP